MYDEQQKKSVYISAHTFLLFLLDSIWGFSLFVSVCVREREKIVFANRFHHVYTNEKCKIVVTCTLQMISARLKEGFK